MFIYYERYGIDMSDNEKAFSDDWIALNPWMAKVIKEKSEPKESLFICHNFSKGIPIKAIRDIQDKRNDKIAEAKSQLDMFNEMMAEGYTNIKPKRGNWGHPRK